MGKLSPGDISKILDEATTTIYVVIDLRGEAKESSLLFKMTETDLKGQFPSHTTS